MEERRWERENQGSEHGRKWKTIALLHDPVVGTFQQNQLKDVGITD